MKARASITVANDLAELARVDVVVKQVGLAHGWPQKLVFEVSLALDEVLTNVISYAYADTPRHEIVVHLTLNGGELVIEVQDDGRPFNPLEVAPPNLDAPLEQRPIGGLGIHLVRQVMDGLAYRRENGKNILTMTKHALPA